MTTLLEAIGRVTQAQKASEKPFAIVIAGHNGSGKSTMWRLQLAPRVQMPLVNADRMMLSVLPEPEGGFLPDWASRIRDEDENWMQVAQKGVESFVAHAMSRKVPFAMETVFSYWVENEDGSISSKVDLIKQMQAAGYFVLLCFVGLTNSTLSVARVATRVAAGGHAVSQDKLLHRFPRTQKAIRMATSIADASILIDNSLAEEAAFTVCRVQLKSEPLFDARTSSAPPPPATREWLDIVSPINE